MRPWVVVLRGTDCHVAALLAMTEKSIRFGVIPRERSDRGKPFFQEYGLPRRCAPRNDREIRSAALPAEKIFDMGWRGDGGILGKEEMFGGGFGGCRRWNGRLTVPFGES